VYDAIATPVSRAKRDPLAVTAPGSCGRAMSENTASTMIPAPATASALGRSPSSTIAPVVASSAPVPRPSG